MKRNLVSAVVCLALSLAMLSACQPAAPDTNRNDSLAAASPTPEPLDRAAIETEVMNLSREWLAAARSKDPEPVRRIVADDAILVYPDGMQATKADEVRTIEAGAITADSWEMFDTKVTVLNKDSAFITGRSIVKNGTYKDPNARRPIDISGEYRFLDLYARRDGRWQVIASQATKVTAPTPVPAPAVSPTTTVSPAGATPASPTP